jgi:hypothetical protein
LPLISFGFLFFRSSKPTEDLVITPVYFATLEKNRLQYKSKDLLKRLDSKTTL